MEPHPVDAEGEVEVARVKSTVEPEPASSPRISAQATECVRHALRKMVYAPASPNPGIAGSPIFARGAKRADTEPSTVTGCSRDRGHRKDSSLRRALQAPLSRSHSSQTEQYRG